MFIVLIWSACIQFHNLAYPAGANRSDVANIVFSFIVLVLAVMLPIATFLYLNHKYFRLDYFEYSYWYQNIFYLQLPEESLPSDHHRILILVRNFRYLLLVVCFAFLGDYPIPCLIIIIFNHLASMLYTKVKNI